MRSVRLYLYAIRPVRQNEGWNLRQHLPFFKTPVDFVEQTNRFHIRVQIEVITAASVRACPEQEGARSSGRAEFHLGFIIEISRLLPGNIIGVAGVTPADAVFTGQPGSHGQIFGPAAEVGAKLPAGDLHLNTFRYLSIRGGDRNDGCPCF
ncbi:hypothetical protein D3C80_1675710 [compost metagenome]